MIIRCCLLFIILKFHVAYSQPDFLNATQVTNGLSFPVSVTNAGDGSGRLFVLEQVGTIQIIDSQGMLLAQPFLDISQKVSFGGEQGLLGLAFHPNYSINGFFYVNYTDVNGNTVVERYSVTAANPNLADVSSAYTILTIQQPFANHNGGDLNFGPIDGFLYISTGDGDGDPFASQDVDQLLGKILRIDIDQDDFPADDLRNYSIPSDNPYVGGVGSDEIWLIGLRNPWRFSFDRSNGNMFIGDVGEATWEEVNFISSGVSGLNFGWPCYEGIDVFLNDSSCGQVGDYDFPALAHSRQNSGDNHCSIIGGYVYRGLMFPGLSGWYIYTDWCDGDFYVARQNGLTWQTNNMGLLIGQFIVTGMGESEEGEIYVVAGTSLYILEGPGDLIFSNDFDG